MTELPIFYKFKKSYEKTIENKAKQKEKKNLPTAQPNPLVLGNEWNGTKEQQKKDRTHLRGRKKNYYDTL